MESRTKNGTRNIIAGLFNQMINVIIPFVVRTVFIQVLGKEYLGLSSLFSSILTVLNLSELGFGSALVFSMYKPIAENNIEKVGALLKIYKKIYRLIGGAILTIGLLLMPFLDKLISGDVPADINIYIVYLIFLFNTSISYFAFAYKKALLKAYQRNDIISNINSLTTFTTNAVQLISLFLVKNYYVYACIYPVFTVIDNLIANYLSIKAFPNVRCVGTITNDEKNSIKKHVIGISIQKFCSTSRNSFDNIAISMFLGLSVVAAYNNYYMIMASLHGVLYQIPNAIRSSVGNSIASMSIDKNYKDFKTMSLIYAWIGGWCAACLICLYQPFMQLWMGDELMLPFSSVILLVCYFYAMCLSDIIALYKDGAGLWWLGKIRTISESFANLILNFLLGWLLGVNGIILASIITITFIGLGYGGYIIFTGYFKGKKYLDYVVMQVKYLIITVIVALITLLLCSFIHVAGFPGLLFKGIVCLIIPNILFFSFLRYDNSYLDAEKLIKAILSSVTKRTKKVI